MACVVVCFAASCASFHHPVQGGSIRFGVLDKQPNGTWTLAHETRTIPLRLRETGFAFGYIYQPSHQDEYTIHDVSYMPAKPVTLGGEIAIHAIESATQGLRTPEYTMRGEHWMEYWFDEGDPLGDYRIDVFVDGRRLDSIRFTVIEDTGAPTTPSTRTQ